MINDKEDVFKELDDLLEKIIDFTEIIEDINLNRVLSCRNRKKIIIKYSNFIVYLIDLDLFKKHMNKEVTKYKQEIINILIKEKYYNDEHEVSDKLNKIIKDYFEHDVCYD